ncbi:hypothetical protein BU25DRAFT_493088 [Macroventuria anomochaeta]|uniref:Uncharacterized protein n=1 Tax=Macroventuria anomochaeta TaxID=301207 RepID=A0ACB6RUY6_9PLEO|nr:uncharacterized protein BU25DRAFT_493088 [Macroventuria anomochaeta]KAF2625092.1 hypothetical protein BU25DRAFT_493088 [Macroventuria anomochaeta]
MSVSDNSTVAVPHDEDIVYEFPREEKPEFDRTSNVALNKSPYVESEIIPLDAGSSATRFLVHSCMLRKSTPLFALASNGQPVSLPKLDESAAHTLVHFLYAGTFQIRFHPAPSDGKVAYERFKLATCVYCAAIRYQLHGLAKLSKEKVSVEGDYIPIFDVLQVARDHAFPLLPETDVWYSGYLEDVIQTAMAKDPEPFRRPDFITKVEGNSRLLQIVWKTVMSSYTAVPPSSTRPPQDSGAETPLAESLLTESEVPTQDSLHQLPSPTESVVDSPSNSKEADDLNEPETLDLGPSTAANLEIQPQAKSRENDPNAQSDTASNDDFGLPAIEPIIEQPEVLKTVDIPPNEVKESEHVRADSVVEEDAVPAVNNSNPDTAKKNKKKGKKRHSSIVF